MAFIACTVFYLWIYCTHIVVAKEKPIVFQNGNTKFIQESFKTGCDHDFVEYFRKVPNSTSLHTFRVVKLAADFTIDITIKVMKTQRIMYKMEKFKGCDFLNNPMLTKIFGEAYNSLVVNGSHFKCPIKPNVYYIKTDKMLQMIPNIHPPGRFQLSVRIKMAENKKPFVMEILLRYQIVRIK
ncbi:uncharacterized protein LOC108096486 [Drosophila ficusphila]|uniref:uncharacterized protein LOC108096486 n=1 Tax=Drosophila ficusphila TaxID=30025 RepID=UPI0007E6103F|nr:uncharacterized protein LOC108096486 [Drosophila ficusphila]